MLLHVGSSWYLTGRFYGCLWIMHRRIAIIRIYCFGISLWHWHGHRQAMERTNAHSYPQCCSHAVACCSVHVVMVADLVRDRGDALVAVVVATTEHSHRYTY